MKNLWFRQCYVGPILLGDKTDTIRKPGGRSYEVGETIALTVGPRPAFAEAVVTAFEPVRAEWLPADRLSAARSFYGDLPAYIRLAFRVSKVCPPPSPRQAGTAPHTQTPR